MNRVIDKRIAHKLIQELHVRAGSDIKRMPAPSQRARDLLKSVQLDGVDPGVRAEQVISREARALAKRQVQRGRPRRRGGEASLEAYPRIVERICQLWGYRELRPYLESLMLVEASRVERQGLQPQAQEELMFLYELTTEFAELLFAPKERERNLQASDLYHFAF